ncbi:universal stress protein [Candidatus Nitrospira bockiana]
MGKTASTLIHRMLFASDFTACSAYAEPYAFSMAKQFDAEFDALYAASPEARPSTELDEEQVIHELAGLVSRAAAHGVVAHALPGTGHSATEVVQTVTAVHADMVALGTRASGFIEQVRSEPLAEAIIRDAPCPVLTVCLPQGDPRRGLRRDHEEQRLNRVLIPLDFSDCSQYALLYGIQMAKELGLEVTLLHVLDWAWIGLHTKLSTLTAVERVRELVEGAVAKTVQDLHVQGVRARYLIKDGAPIDIILETSRDTDCSMLVIGTHGHHGLKRLVLGSVARAAVAAAACPVLTINPHACRSSAVFSKPFLLRGVFE